jgi:hypothetical protein
MDYKEYIDNNTLRLDYSRRGGGIEINCQSLFPYLEDARMTAYQNYLGGGMLGAVCSDNNFFNELRPKDLKKFYPLELALKQYFHFLTNEEANDWDEWSSTDYEDNQKKPVSAY